jgi:DNA-binding CsgD family transcriptional regulator
MEREREELLSSITPRELDFLRLVCSEQELTYDQIAESMGVHRRTVDHFRQALFDKLHIKSKTGLVLFAMRYGIIQ